MRFIFGLIFCCIINVFIRPLYASVVLRDAEIEELLYELALPITQFAKLPSNKLRIYIIDNNEVNAFASANFTLAFHTGLLKNYPDPAVIAAILAHEIGHVTNNHLHKIAHEETRAKAKMISLSSIMLVGGLLANNLGNTTNTPPTEIIKGAFGLSAQVAERHMLTFSRAMEFEADNFGLAALKAVNYPIKPLLTFFKHTQTKEAALALNPYLSTHPSSQNRLENIQAFITKNEKVEHKFPEQYITKYRRALIKLHVLLTPNILHLSKILPNQTTEEIAYAKIWADYKVGKLEAAINSLNKFIQREPTNPFLQEAKAEILYNQGHFKEAVAILYNVSTLLPSNNLIIAQLSIAELQLAKQLNNMTDKNQLLEAIIARLHWGLTQEENDINLISILALTYGEKNLPPMADLWLAKKFLLLEDKKQAKLFAKRAFQALTPGENAYFEAKSILKELK